MKVKQAAKDWGAILMGIAALAGVGVSYIQAIKSSDATVQEVSEQGAKLEKAYSVLTEAYRQLATDSKEQAKTIADMRESIGEIKGTLRAMRYAGGTMRLDRNTMAPATEQPTMPEPSAPIELPATLEVPQEEVQQRVDTLKSKM